MRDPLASNPSQSSNFVLGQFGDTLHCRQAPKSNTRLASKIHEASLQGQGGWYTVGQSPRLRVTLGTRETGTAGVCGGGQNASGALMQSLHHFLTEGWGTPGALIRPRSPQFGDSAAAEIWQIRTISQRPSGGSCRHNWKGGGEKGLRRQSRSYRLLPRSRGPPTSACKSGCLKPPSDLIRNRASPSQSHSVSVAGYAISARELSSAQLYIQEPL